MKIKKGKTIYIDNIPYKYLGNGEIEEKKAKKINIGFDIFWDLYDKKADKVKSERKWNNLKDQEREDIIKYIPAYKKSQTDKMFRKDPCTFLNNRSWENEIIVSEKKEEAKPYIQNSKTEDTRPKTPEEWERRNKNLEKLRRDKAALLKKL